MSGTEPPVAIGPQAYAAWRTMSLGAVTEALELQATLDLMGEREARLLDVGCGDGALACIAASRRAQVTGVDFDPATVAVARMRVARVGIAAKFVEGPVERLPSPDAGFEVTAAIAVLCFFSDATGAMREMARVLRRAVRWSSAN